MKQIHFIKLLIAIAFVSLFASCSKNSTDLIPVAYEGKWGYINQKGEYVISPRYKDAGFFYDGLAMVKDMNGNIGYIDKDANFVIQPKYKFGTMFNEEHAIVVESGEYPVCVDKKGNVVVTMKNILKLYNFRDGLAAFQDTSKKYGFIDEKGKVVIAPKYDNVYFGFNEGLAPVQIDGKWGFIDKTGKLVISAQFVVTGLFSEGVAVASLNGNLYGYIGKNGLFKIQPQFDEASMFFEKHATVKLAGKYATINTSGKIDVNPVYDEINNYANGFALMKLGQMYGYLNAKGEMPINAQFAWETDFFDNVAVVKTFDQYGNGNFRYALIDKDGKFVSFPNIEDVKASYINYGEDENFAKSDYYDASEFINKFGSKVTEGSFDGFTKKSTAFTIAEHSLYGEYANAIDSVTIFAANLQSFSKEISCSSVEFNFDEPVVSIDSTDSTKLNYQLNAPISSIAYNFNLLGYSVDKGCAIAKALSQSIASKWNTSAVSKDGYYYILQDNNNANVVILYNDVNLCMLVNFNTEKMQKKIDFIQSHYNAQKTDAYAVLKKAVNQ